MLRIIVEPISVTQTYKPAVSSWLKSALFYSKPSLKKRDPSEIDVYTFLDFRCPGTLVEAFFTKQIIGFKPTKAAKKQSPGLNPSSFSLGV